MKKLIIIFGLCLLLALTYLLGPRPATPDYQDEIPELNLSSSDLDAFITRGNDTLDLRSGNASEIHWAYADQRRTPTVFLYLHGFSASPHEGYPLHLSLADTFSSNLYLPRLAAHGYRQDQLKGFTAEKLWESALEALAVAQKLGDRVVILSTSTGGTLALKLAASFPDQVHALINLSPNVRINNPAGVLLNNPWGLQLARLVFGGKQRHVEHDESAATQYWDTLYPAEATVQLQELLETSMTEATFEQVKCPTLNLFYFKNEEEQDQVVSTEAIRWMHESLATPDSLKKLKALSEPGDHVIGSSIKSHNWRVVFDECFEFCEQVLELKTPGRNKAG